MTSSSVFSPTLRCFLVPGFLVTRPSFPRFLASCSRVQLLSVLCSRVTSCTVLRVPVLLSLIQHSALVGFRLLRVFLRSLSLSFAHFSSNNSLFSFFSHSVFFTLFFVNYNFLSFFVGDVFLSFFTDLFFRFISDNCCLCLLVDSSFFCAYSTFFCLLRKTFFFNLLGISLLCVFFHILWDSFTLRLFNGNLFSFLYQIFLPFPPR